MKAYTKILIIALLIYLYCVNEEIYGQTNIERNKTVTSCEQNEATLDQIAWLLSNDGDKDSFLLVIAHLGSGEFSGDLINHRLYNATEYMLARNPSLSRQRIIIARGERVDGMGRIDFWSKGKITDSLFTKKNKTLCVDCCENKPISPYKKNSWKLKL